MSLSLLICVTAEDPHVQLQGAFLRCGSHRFLRVRRHAVGGRYTVSDGSRVC